MKPTIDELLTRYYAGETTLDEEKQLRTFFENPQQVPDRFQQHTALFGYTAGIRAQQPSAAFAARLDGQLRPRPTAKIRQLIPWSLRLAAGVALLLVGFAGGQLYTRWQADPLAVNSLATNQPGADSMKKVLAFDARKLTSASDRIQAVNHSFTIDRADRDMTQLLINTLNFDANVNVRLAACQALVRFEREDGVREALIQSLRIQKDPNVQLSLIDALVSIKEKRATAEMQWLARNQQVLDIVRLKAAEGVGTLTGISNSPS